MRKIFILLSLTLSALVLACGCAGQDDALCIYVTNSETGEIVTSYDKGETWDGEAPGVYMVINYPNVKSTVEGISATIINADYAYPVEVTTSDLFRLYRFENDEWVLCDEKMPDGTTRSFSDVGETVPEGESQRFSCELKYYELSSGKYKIVKYITVDEWNEENRLWYKDLEAGAEFIVG